MLYLGKSIIFLSNNAPGTEMVDSVLVGKALNNLLIITWPNTTSLSMYKNNSLSANLSLNVATISPKRILFLDGNSGSLSQDFLNKRLSVLKQGCLAAFPKI